MDREGFASLLDSGPAILGASADDKLSPEAFRVWGASIDMDSGVLRSLVSADAKRTLATVGMGSRMSFTITDVHTFRSMQVKGGALGPPEPPGPADIVMFRRYGEVFLTRLVEIGHGPALAASMQPPAVFVVSLVIDDLYDQTPGPRAGVRLGVAE